MAGTHDRTRTMRGPLAVLLTSVLVLGGFTTAQAVEASPSPTPTTEPTVSPSAAPTASSLPEPTPTASPEPVPATSATPEPTVERTPAPQASSRVASIATGFLDVSSVPGTTGYSPFAAEIAWLSGEGVSEGWKASGGRVFKPVEPVRRDVMAAFLYRLTGEPFTGLPVVSPFRDVTRTGSPFYPEITWLEGTGVSRGWTTSKGTVYRPTSAIAREEIAAFLYRLAGSPRFTTPSTLPFTDIAGSAFTKEIAWLASTGVTEGWDTATGAEFRPRTQVTREAMAAFLFRLSDQGLVPELATTGTLRHTTMYVYDANLNFRTGPATSYSKVVTLAEGTAVRPTGTTKNGWIEVTYNGTRMWASGKYLVGRGGDAVTRITASYTNGRLPKSELCYLSWDTSETVECTAARDLEALNAAFTARWGYHLTLNDTYRDYDTQVEFKKIYGNLAATPGTSNHGWGHAIDVSTQAMGGPTSTPYAWLTQHLAVYNWVHPAWARTTGSKPEAWHFEYTG